MANITELKYEADRYLSDLYIDKNFDDIMSDLLSRVPDDIDKREGSVIYDALAPVAMELVLLYYEYLDAVRNSFGITADRPSLILRALDRDVHIKEATHSIVKGAFNREIPQGYRFNYEKLNFRVEDSLGVDGKRNLYLYKLRAEEPGEIGNVAFGNLTPIDEIGNLSYAKIEGVLTPGADAEDTEAFRRRYYDSIKRSDYGGNIDDYKRKVTAIDGVGAVKVYPVWNGGGTVKLVIQNSEYKTPSKEMIDDVQTKVDPVTNHGKGMGIAPIGHTVTVTGAVRMPIKVKTTYEKAVSADQSVIEGKIQSKINRYMEELAEKWWESTATIIRISRIESLILEVDGVIDVKNTSINGQEDNLQLSDEAYPALEEVTYA